jgi:putative effector of murein hydrolase
MRRKRINVFSLFIFIMSRVNRIHLTLPVFIITAATFAVLVPGADAYQRYNNGGLSI